MPALGLMQESGQPSKRVGVGRDETLEKRMQEFLDKWDAPEFGEKKDKSILEVMKKEVVDMSYKLVDVEHAATYSWELDLPSPLADKAKEWTKKWDDKRGKVAKTPAAKTLGHVKNYVFVGLVNTVLTETAEDSEGHTTLVRHVLQLAGNGQDKLDDEKVSQLDKMVAFCRVKTVDKAKTCFLTLKIRDEFSDVQKIMHEWLDANGKRQLDPTPVRPGVKELKGSKTTGQ